MARNAVLVVSIFCLLAQNIQAGWHRPDPENNPDFWVNSDGQKTARNIVVACAAAIGLVVGYGVAQYTQRAGNAPELPAPYFSEDSPFQEPPDFSANPNARPGQRFDTGPVRTPNGGTFRGYGTKRDDGYDYGYEYNYESSSGTPPKQ